MFVQDYHFALLPRMLKDARPDLVVCQFWHIPWPNPETFRVCPWEDELLDGMLGNDLLGFHIQYHCNNFLETVDRTLEARIDTRRFAVHRGGHDDARAAVSRSASIRRLWAAREPGGEWETEVAQIARARSGSATRLCSSAWTGSITRRASPSGSGRSTACSRRHPEWSERFHFVQVGAPEPRPPRRATALERRGRRAGGRRSTRGTAPHGWQPVVFLNEHHGPEDIAALYRAADACVVRSLHDGMNLVAKEFVAARGDERGVLVLSQFTGAARAMTDAVQVNPFATDEFAEVLHEALVMPKDDQTRRMRALRERVHGHTVFDWADKMLTAASRIAEKNCPLPQAPRTGS